MRRLTFFALLFVAASGCASPLSTFQTARTTPKGEFDAHAGVGANVSTGFVGSLTDLGEDAADKARTSIENGETPTLSQEDKENLIGTALSYALFGPTPVFEAGVRYGILDFWDAGVTYTSAGFRFETKFMLMSQQKGQGLDLSVGLTAMNQSYEPPVPGFLQDIFQLEKMTRTDIAVPVLLGKHFGENSFVYGGPKFIYSDLELGFVEQISDATEQAFTADDDLMMFGGVIGTGLGWRYVFVMLELNALYYSYNATILGAEVDVNGMDFYPGLGLRFQFY
jgi:hypothetical protein